MADLSGGAYIVSGLILSIISTILVISGKKSFYFFMFAGFIMIITGSIKLSASKTRRNMKKSHCPKCNYAVRNSFNYCYNCGSKLKK